MFINYCANNILIIQQVNVIINPENIITRLNLSIKAGITNEANATCAMSAEIEESLLSRALFFCVNLIEHARFLS